MEHLFDDDHIKDGGLVGVLDDRGFLGVVHLIGYGWFAAVIVLFAIGFQVFCP